MKDEGTCRTSLKSSFLRKWAKKRGLGTPAGLCNFFLISWENGEKRYLIQGTKKKSVSLSNRRRYENWIVPLAKDAASDRNVFSLTRIHIYIYINQRRKRNEIYARESETGQIFQSFQRLSKIVHGD